MKNTKFSLIFAFFILLAFGQGFAAETIQKWTDVAVEPQVETIGGKDYRMIYTANELAWISLKTKGGGSSYNVKLMNDIDLAGKLWLPICAGNHSTGWAGTFDGNGHSIRNLYIRGADIITAYNDSSYAQNIGFIAVFTSGTIKNLALENVNIYATNNKTSAFGGGDEISVGSLIGYKTNNGGLVDGIMTSGAINVSGDKQGVGGIVGNAHSSTIQNCVSSVNIYSSGNEAFIGGIVGLVKNKTVQITSCVYAGETLLNTGEGGYTGAIVGKVYKGSAKASTANVFYDSDQFGNGIGLVDKANGGNSSGTITPVSDLNSEEVVCKLNGGTWNAGTCSGDTSSVWAVGISGVSLNGSDGFKITFNANGGTFPVGAKTSKTLLLGKTIIADEIGIPTHESLSFAGWSLNKDAVDPDENLGTVDGPDTVYAVWYPYYDVTFASTSGVLNGTTIVKKIAKNDNVNINDIVFPDPYEHCDETDGNGTCLKTTMLYFTGWTQKVLDNPEESYIIGKGVSYSDTIHVEDIKVTGDVTIYSVWTAVPTYTVTYDANGHGRTWVDYVQVEEGQSVTSPENPVANPGYKFVAWYTEPECNNTFGFGTSITKNETLYAGWELESYSITYDLDKGTNDDDNPSSYDVTTPTIVFKKPTREGYSFEGWFYDKGFTMRATQITQGTAEDITIYAKWEINTYSIVYMSGTSVSGTSVADKKDWDETITLKGVVDEFYREGFVQDGWSVEDGGELTYKVGASYSENKNLVLYPHWVVAYTISYLPGDGEGITGERANDIKAEGYDFDMPGETFFREGDYEQNGWINSATDEEIDLGAKYTADADATFYPRWALKTYTITYVLNEGSFAGEYPKTYTIAGLASLPSPVKSGSKFLGWFNESEELVESIPSNSTGNITLTAQWAEYPILVATYGGVSIYENENGTTSALIDDEAMTPISIPENVTVNSVTFNRSFPLVKYSTVVLPFSIDTNKVNGAEFYSVVMMKQAGKWVAGASQVKTTQLVANTPYLLFAKEQNLTFYGPVTFNTSEMHDSTTVYEEDGCAWTFKGTYTKHVWGEGDPELGKVYAFSAHDVSDDIKIGKFTKFGKDAWIRPMRAYLIYEQLPSSDPEPDNAPNARSFKPMPFTASIEEHDVPEWIDVVIIGDDVEQTTPIARLNTRTGDVRMMEGWYDMKGRKLNGKPTTKGTYYNNGKRVVVK
ncbi:InlB B-repeat-containing protein [Fibrobacter sp.]|uniref:InlB B-repeat-containing protein n=1 Tax=Fibrobacter sp. TaxID=35828 RepID=UPI00388E60F5